MNGRKREAEVVGAKLDERPVEDLELSGAELVAEHTGRRLTVDVSRSHPGSADEYLDSLPVDWRAFYGDPLVSDEEAGR